MFQTALFFAYICWLVAIKYDLKSKIVEVIEMCLALRISQMRPHCCICEIGKMITEGIVWAIID